MNIIQEKIACLIKITCSTGLIKKFSNYKLLPNKFSENSQILNCYDHCEVL